MKSLEVMDRCSGFCNYSSDRNNMKTIAIDLDGTLAEYSGYKGIDIIGDPIPGAREFVKKLSEKALILIFTCRVTYKEDGRFTGQLSVLQRHSIIIEWMKKHDIYYDEIYIGQGKPYACAYVDDRAVKVEAEDKDTFEKAYEECTKLLEKYKGNYSNETL